MCPQTGEQRTNSDYPTNPVYFTHPIVTIAWMTTDKYNSISKLNKYVFSNSLGRTISNADYMHVDAFNSVHVPLLRFSGTTNTYGGATDPTGTTQADNKVRQIFAQYDSTLTDRTVSLLELEARFLRYNLTTDNNDKRLVMKLASTSLATYVSAVSVFLSTKITSISSSVTHDISTHYTTNNFKTKTMNSNVYILGKPFNKYLVFSDFNNIERIFSEFKDFKT